MVRCGRHSVRQTRRLRCYSGGSARTGGECSSVLACRKGEAVHVAGKLQFRNGNGDGLQLELQERAVELDAGQPSSWRCARVPQSALLHALAMSKAEDGAASGRCTVAFDSMDCASPLGHELGNTSGFVGCASSKACAIRHARGANDSCQSDLRLSRRCPSLWRISSVSNA